MTEPNPWLFGWEALVALGTVLLALATAVLAFVTRRVALATRDEVSSQTRPVLLPCDVDELAGRGIEVDDTSIVLRIRNGGRGPAFDIQCRLEPGGLAPDDWSHGILEQNSDAELQFTQDELTAEDLYELSLRYRDLAGRDYSTVIWIKRIARQQDGELRQDYVFQRVMPETSARKRPAIARFWRSISNRAVRR